MAITVALPTNGSGTDATNQIGATTGSIAFVSGRLYVICVRSARSGAAPDSPGVSGATSGTWQGLATKLYNPAAAAQRSRLRALYYKATGTFSETLAISGTNANLNHAWIVVEITGHSDSAAIPFAGNGQTDAQDAGTTPTVALATFGSAGNLSLGFVGVDNGSGVQAAGGMTALVSNNVESESLGCVYKVGDEDPSATVSSGDWAMIGLEIAVDVTAQTTVSVATRNALARRRRR